MIELFDDCSACLDVMRKWDWSYSDLDGNEGLQSMELSELINRLAMAGQFRPENAVLSLLCQGELKAKGSYQWKKYDHWEIYEHSENYSTIEQEQWQRLSVIRSEYWNSWDKLGFDGISHEVTLNRLGLTAAKIFEWNYKNNQFSTSRLYTETGVEEWFSAWDITILPRFINDALEEAAIELANTGTSSVQVAKSLALPSNEVILAKCLELSKLGIKRDDVAKLIRQIAGFEGVQNEHARRLLKGNLDRGRPKKER